MLQSSYLVNLSILLVHALGQTITYDLFVPLLHDVSKMQTLKAKFDDIYDPNSPNYMNYLSESEIISYMSQSSQTEVKCLSCAKNFNYVAQVSSWGDICAIRSIPLSAYTSVVSCIYAPSEAEKFMTNFIQETQNNSPLPKKFKHQQDNKVLDENNANDYLTPDSITNYYKAVNVESALPWDAKNIAAVGCPYLGPNSSGYYNNIDLLSFCAENGLNITDINIDFISPSPADLYTHPPVTDLEPNLDIQFTVGMLPGNKVDFFHVPSNEPGIFLLMGLVFALENRSPKPLTFSLSYLFKENQSLKLYFDHMNDIFMAFGAMGVSLFAAAGDDGSYFPTSTNNATEICASFVPVFPASSPFVTAVGATSIGGQTETLAWKKSLSFITSGGGYSTFFNQPSYQASVVSKYLQQIPSQSYFPPSSAIHPRFYPDISLVGQNYGIFANGVYERVDGTSASSPTLAAIISRYNNIRIKSGFRPLGFINPLLYGIHESNPEAFTDITEGDTSCTSGGSICCSHGFSSTTGFDAASGLGSPKFDILGKFLLRETPILPIATTTSSPNQPSNIDGKNSYLHYGIVGGVTLIVVSLAFFIYRRVMNKKKATSNDIQNYERLNA